MKVLLTGGAGFVGSHTALAVIEAGHEPILFDDYSNSRPEVIDRLSELAGRSMTAIRGDICDVDRLKSLFASHDIGAVIHFAARKSVAESVEQPIAYYSNNIGGLLSLVEAMDAASVRTIVFSSSAAVYGAPDCLPIPEDHPTRPANPYGHTKLLCENMLAGLAELDRGWRVSLLRYFNPVGAHPSGLIGEDSRGTPTNLMPLVARVALGQDSHLQIFGRDYPTADGTAVRDYVHVVDLAEAHVAALGALDRGDPLQIFNLGTGRGTSVLELVSAFGEASGRTIALRDAARRDGDVATLCADVEKAAQELGWRAKRGIGEMCADSWHFVSRQ
jgi:UDP-glucose 4-epimerase